MDGASYVSGGRDRSRGGRTPTTGVSCEEAVCAGHLPHHFGADRTLFLPKQIGPDRPWSESCKAVSHVTGLIVWGVRKIMYIMVARGWENWLRIVADVTYDDGNVFLTMVDYEPSRFSIWRILSRLLWAVFFRIFADVSCTFFLCVWNHWEYCNFTSRLICFSFPSNCRLYFLLGQLWFSSWFCSRIFFLAFQCETLPVDKFRSFFSGVFWGSIPCESHTQYGQVFFASEAKS